jgi:hypothetical protein
MYARDPKIYTAVETSISTCPVYLLAIAEPSCLRNYKLCYLMNNIPISIPSELGSSWTAVYPPFAYGLFGKIFNLQNCTQWISITFVIWNIH